MHLTTCVEIAYNHRQLHMAGEGGHGGALISNGKAVVQVEHIRLTLG